VTDTIESTPAQTSGDAGAPAAKKKSGGLNSLLLADLKSMAGSLGIAGAGSMKKAQLVDAIKAAQAGGRGGSQGRPADPVEEKPAQASQRETQRETQPETRRDDGEPGGTQQQERRGDRQQGDGQSKRDQSSADQSAGEQSSTRQGRDRQQTKQNKQGNQAQQQGQQPDTQDKQDKQDKQSQGQPAEDGESGSRRSRRRRGRERTARPQPGQRNEPDTTILDDDVLTPAAGILDVLDNYAFVRTSGYLPGTDDVYVSLSMVRKYGLRRGDAIVGQVRQPREGERKEKFNPMVRIDSVNGADPEAAKNRVEFAKLTPLYPSERLRLETEPTNLIGRVIDIASPIGKGQRGLIVSPAKAGKTMIMQSIAKSITTNNPECHLMVVLVDERPEEVTDFERSTKGEVISSTFDRPASDHTMVAELAIERAKRLVELGHDVVVLLDGITRLGRAYNLAAPASGRILSGGVDSAALYPPKKFFGAARNIENGGSLTILATALIESGSKMDEVIFEEFKGTGNMEIRLRRDFADKRLFPAIDAVQSGTRREELLMSNEELQIVWKLRRVLSGLESQQALELLLGRLKKTQTNIEFLMQVQKTTPGDIAETR
jgi:transcription termination factor Rho